MSTWPRPARIAALLAAFLAFLLLLHRQTASSPLPAAAMASPDVLSKLTVSVSQSATSPPTLAVKVVNGNDVPVTVLTWDSPLDPAALSLGVVHITPAGAAAPLELPTIMFRRLMPPAPESLVTIEPGAAVEREMVLKDEVVPADKLFGSGGAPARVTLKGRWTCVWVKRRADISEESLDRTSGADDAVEGEFESNETEVKRA
ncbi:hypothetical protein RB595_010582 [Gaeumannomyces hyphopodioides]